MSAHNLGRSTPKEPTRSRVRVKYRECVCRSRTAMVTSVTMMVIMTMTTAMMVIRMNMAMTIAMPIMITMVMLMVVMMSITVMSRARVRTWAKARLRRCSSPSKPNLSRGGPYLGPYLVITSKASVVPVKNFSNTQPLNCLVLMIFFRGLVGKSIRYKAEPVYTKGCRLLWQT